MEIPLLDNFSYFGDPVILFWFSIFFVLYTYAGYPAVLFLISRIAPKPVNKCKPTKWPIVTVIIAAKDEEKRINHRLENLLIQKYPGRLEVIVVSDGSNDQTYSIVKSYDRQYQKKGWQIHAIEYRPSKGKPYAINKGALQASGEILVFADSRQKFDDLALSELIKNFAQENIGAVSGELIFLESHDSDIKKAMGAYWGYEKIIRKLESKTGSVIGATGAIYAIRSHLFKPIPPETLLDDVLIPMKVIQQGYRVIFDSKAVAFDMVSENISSEWRRKVRTLAGNWQLLSLEPHLFVPFISNVWWRFLSHKIFRLIVPFLLPVIFGASYASQGIFYDGFTWLQVIFYVVMLLAWLFPCLQRLSIVKLGYFFLVLNMAALAGFLYWISGNTSQVWRIETR